MLKGGRGKERKSKENTHCFVYDILDFKIVLNKTAFKVENIPIIGFWKYIKIYTIIYIE